MDAVYQISCCTPSTDYANRLAGKIQEMGFQAYPNIEYVDIVQRRVSKAESLSYLANYLSISDSAIYSARDGRNDITMLSQFCGFSMSKAEKMVQYAADFTVDTVSQALKCISKECLQ